MFQLRSVLLAAVVLAGSVALAGGETALPLWKAAEEKRVTVEVTRVDGHHRVRLRIANKGDEALLLDVNGSYLSPDEDRVQPLGLGLLSDTASTRTSMIHLRARATREVEVLTVCMKASAASPRSTTKLRLVEAPPAEEIAKSLRRWRDDSSVSQSDAQAAVWRHREPREARVTSRTVVTSPGSPSLPPPAPSVPCDLPAGTWRIAVVQGEVYALTREGSLACARPDSSWVELATGVDDFVADRSSVRALFERGLARLDVNGTGRWQDELAVERRGQLVWASAAAALLEDVDGLYLVSPKGVVRTFAEGSSASARDRTAVVWVPGDEKTEVTRIVPAPRGATVETTSVAAVLSSVVVLSNRVLALATDGRSGAVRFDEKSGPLAGDERLDRPPPPPGHRLVADEDTGVLYAWQDTAILRHARGRWLRLSFRR